MRPPETGFHSKFAGRQRPCAARVKDFFVPFSSPGKSARGGESSTTTTTTQRKPLALVVQFHALHNPIENVRLRLTAYKRGESGATCRQREEGEEGEGEGEGEEGKTEAEEDPRENGFVAAESASADAGTIDVQLYMI